MSALEAVAQEGVPLRRQRRNATTPRAAMEATDEKRIGRLFRYAFGITFAVLALIGALLCLH